MTYYDGQRWVATPSEIIAGLMMRYRDDTKVLERFYAKIDFGGDPAKCDIWTGALSDEGYGDFRLPGKTVRAHRFAYVVKFGEIPDKTPFLDHKAGLCHGRFCVNVEHHLEPVTNQENTLRGTGTGRLGQRQLRDELLQKRYELRNRGH